MEIII